MYSARVSVAVELETGDGGRGRGGGALGALPVDGLSVNESGAISRHLQCSFQGERVTHTFKSLPSAPTSSQAFPTTHTSSVYRCVKTERQRLKKVASKTGVTWPQAKRCRRPPGTGRGCSPRAPGGSTALRHPDVGPVMRISDFWPPDL